jgi:hypothetical protein
MIEDTLGSVVYIAGRRSSVQWSRSRGEDTARTHADVRGRGRGRGRQDAFGRAAWERTVWFGFGRSAWLTPTASAHGRRRSLCGRACLRDEVPADLPLRVGPTATRVATGRIPMFCCAEHVDNRTIFFSKNSTITQTLTNIYTRPYEHTHTHTLFL